MVYRGINAMLGDQWWDTMATSLGWTGLPNRGICNTLQDISALNQESQRTLYWTTMCLR